MIKGTFHADIALDGFATLAMTMLERRLFHIGRPRS
jgi:hypothetical protein